MLIMLSRTRSLKILFLGSCILLLTNCRSTDLSKFPVADRTLFIYNFANDSFQPDFNIQLYRSLKAEIGRRNNFELQSENSTAKLHLYGSIEAFQNKGLMYDSLRTPTRISITAVCKIRLYDVSGTAKNLVFSREFASRIEQSRETGTGDTDKATYVRLSRMLAQQIANGMETEFINMTKQKP